jgi:SAM-dependent methyltransferase
MKIAICFSGQIRTGIEASPNILRYIGDLLPNCDFFVHTWDIRTYADTRLASEFTDENAIPTNTPYKVDPDVFAEFHKIYKPITMTVEKFSLWLTNHRLNNNIGIHPLFYSVHNANKLKMEYEERLKFTYDYVIRLRPDVIFESTKSLKEDITLITDDRTFSFCSFQGLVPDTIYQIDNAMWIGSSYVIDKSCEFCMLKANAHPRNIGYDEHYWFGEWMAHGLRFNVVPMNDNKGVALRQFHIDYGLTCFDFQYIADMPFRIADGKISPVYCSLEIEQSTDVELLYTFKDFPVCMGPTLSETVDDLAMDMNFYINKNSGNIHMNPVLPLDIVYGKEHNSGTVGNIWKEHHKMFAKFIHKHTPRDILEIGGGHGILSKEYNSYSDVNWTIIEPNPTPVAGCTANIIRGFFDNTIVDRVSFDTVVHSHVFEHMYEPEKFIEIISNTLPAHGKMIFSVPNMKKMLEKRFINCLNYEHTFYLTEEYISFLLSRHKLRLIDKEYYLEDHSIFYAVVKDETVIPTEQKNMYVENKELFQEYIKEITLSTQEINDKIKDIKENIFLFGAHVFSLYSINLGLDTTNIVSILDNDISKQGKRLYGTKLYTQSPKVLSGLTSPVVILKAGTFCEEIKKDILENINSSTIFL